MSVRKLHAGVSGAPLRIEIRNPAGSVTLEALEGADSIDVRVEALEAAAEDLLDQVEIEVTDVDPDRVDSPRLLRISVPERTLWRTPRFGIRVTTPPDATVRVAVASADVELRGRFARTELTSASGDLAADHCASLQLRSASGDARIGTVAGEAVLGSASGDLRLERADGGLKARTASGDVSVESAAGTVGITTASGEVSIGAIGEGRLKVKSVSGDVTVGVVPGLRLWLDLSTVSGRMKSELHDDGAGTGAGEPQLSISIRSVSGDQHILRAAGAALG
jgi:DUF4097 and DUF4098 domain-containing protein YvlB